MGWENGQRGRFIRIQFTAQERHYGAMYPERDDRVFSVRDCRWGAPGQRRSKGG